MYQCQCRVFMFCLWCHRCSTQNWCVLNIQGTARSTNSNPNNSLADPILDVMSVKCSGGCSLIIHSPLSGDAPHVIGDTDGDSCRLPAVENIKQGRGYKHFFPLLCIKVIQRMPSNSIPLHPPQLEDHYPYKKENTQALILFTLCAACCQHSSGKPKLLLASCTWQHKTILSGIVASQIWMRRHCLLLLGVMCNTAVQWSTWKLSHRKMKLLSLWGTFQRSEILSEHYQPWCGIFESDKPSNSLDLLLKLDFLGYISPSHHYLERHAPTPLHSHALSWCCFQSKWVSKQSPLGRWMTGMLHFSNFTSINRQAEQRQTRGRKQIKD